MNIDHSFTAIDFETSTSNPNSICQVGIVRVEDLTVTQKISQLIQPPNNGYYYKNIEIHGITADKTKNSPLFKDYWLKMRPFIENQVVVAHNSAFDVNCLRSTLDFYQLEQPEFEERCTRTIYRKGLAYLSKKYKITLNHHDALSDAHACAQLYLLHMKKLNLPKTGSLF